MLADPVQTLQRELQGRQEEPERYSPVGQEQVVPVKVEPVTQAEQLVLSEAVQAVQSEWH